MSTTQQITNAADIICGLKAAVTALECYHHMDILKKTQELKRQKPTPPPMFMMIPIEEKDDENKRPHAKHKHTKSIEDVQIIKKHSSHTKLKPKEDCNQLAIEAKFPEMRGGILYSRCYCVHRDGLQNSCPLTSCQEHPDCEEKPWPKCTAAKFIRCRYPQQFPKENNNKYL